MAWLMASWKSSKDDHEIRDSEFMALATANNGSDLFFEKVLILFNQIAN